MNEREDYYQHTRPEVAAFLPQEQGRVLEIGCGEGSFGVHLKEATEYWGIEPVAEIAERARENVQTKVLTGIYDDVAGELPDDYFDTVVCNDVIEHMTDHDHFLDDIRTKMKPGGKLVGSIPNIRYLPVLVGLLVKKDWQYEESGVMDRTHFRYFTNKSLRRCFEDHGYSIEEFSGINNLSNVAETTGLKMRSLVLKTADILTFRTQHDCLFQQFAFRVSA